ncbi:hypothetical protein QJS10_CPA06g01444 [Acorus calamus]|uniref:Uncharacterized protein n=1 Tax=Acorus calamus TaxID=4465 RepID=A0AAV9EN17_ACOCL|nr:hypothetical protein QJS10_CPA06g01444 [Acorus calamus]
MLQRGLLEHADGNGDWALTIFRALSSIIDVLEFTPSHVAVVFDHDGEMIHWHWHPLTVLSILFNIHA